ncbi:hypothetical protein DL96DRAFT_237146 [Flagelloscypha sp. PMI_526]|nr:hypothetical protein DL96DRAFT_237146 [Flagelloscypha sp. PMI_526]
MVSVDYTTPFDWDFFKPIWGCSNVLHENSILNNNLEDDDGLASFPSDIKHLVVGQMLDPHIFGTLKKVFYDINGVPTFQLRQKKLADRSDSFAKAWMDVITVFEEIQRLVPDNTVIFSLEDRRKECFNHQCPNRSSTSASNCGLKFKTCVRCHGAWYCSRRCQRTDYQIHQYFCHSPAVGSAQELLRPASILTIKSFTSSVVYSYLVRSGREEQVKYSQASCTDDHNKDIAASVMISLEPFRIESNFHPFRGSELEKAYHTIGSEGERKKLWMNHPHILKARGVSKDKVDKDVVVHLDITVPRSLKEAQYRIHAICLLSMLVA